MSAPDPVAVAEFDDLARSLGEPARDNGPLDRHYWCPSCQSVDNLHVWVDSHGLGAHCFGCRAGIPDVREALGEGATPPVVTMTRSAKKKLGRVVGREVFEIRDAGGKLVSTHTRLDLDDGKKVVYWPKGTDPKSLPLYGSEDVASFDPALPVVVTEGERKRDRLRDAGYQAVALAGGSSAPPSVAALSVLSGLRVVLWPDNDDPGRKVMDEVARVVRPMASEVRVVDWPGAPPAGDAADFLDAHAVDECDALLLAAPAFAADPDGWGGGTSVDVLDLIQNDYPEVSFVVPGILPEGSAILASNPKIGKSAMVYQLSAELALGGEFLGRKLERRPVVYYALEDGERRSQQRALAALGRRRPRRGTLSFRWAAPTLGSGLEAEVETWLDDHPGGVVFIDTFQKVRAVAKGNANAYQVDVAEFTVLQNIIRRRTGASIVLVLHLRKATDKDFLARVSGTLGITGSADTTLVLERDRHSEAATMHVTGRDVGEQEVPLRFDGTLWSPDEERVPGASPEQQQVFDVIGEKGPIWPGDIADEINSRGGETNRTSVQNLVGKLKESGVVLWTQRGYVHAGVTVNGKPVVAKQISDDSDDSDDPAIAMTQMTLTHRGSPVAAGRATSGRRAPESSESSGSPQSSKPSKSSGSSGSSKEQRGRSRG